MNDLRTLIQQKLAEIDDIVCGVPIPDDLVEDNKTYFGYEIQEVYYNSDFDSNYSMRVVLTGRLVRRVQLNEETLKILGVALEEIKEKLKSLNFRYSYNDITLDKNIRKYFVSAEVNYNELNHYLC